MNTDNALINELQDFMFNELQTGWKISANTMEYNKQNYRTQYV